MASKFLYLATYAHVHRFSDGYTLQVKVKTTAYTESPAAGEAVPSPPPPYTAEPGMPPQDIDIINRLKGYIQQSFYGSVLLEEHQVYIIMYMYVLYLSKYSNTVIATCVNVLNA